MHRQTGAPPAPWRHMPHKAITSTPTKAHSLFAPFWPLSSYLLDLWSTLNSSLVPHFCLILSSVNLSSYSLCFSFLSCFIHIFSFLHLKAKESVDSQRWNVSPPVRILCSSQLAGSFQQQMCCDEVFWTPSMTNFHSASGCWPTYCFWNIAF